MSYGRRFLCLFLLLPGFYVSSAQPTFSTSDPLIMRVGKTPEKVLQAFRSAGMTPTEHRLTVEERGAINIAFNSLPPLHKQVLMQHLASISFLDSMPNTALTAIIDDQDSSDRKYHIAFRAAILHQTISEWLTEKEKSCYRRDSSGISVVFDAGTMNAFVYVLLHESTHVVDGSLGIFEKASPFAAAFTKGVWLDRSTPAVGDSLINNNYFRHGGRGRVYPDSLAVNMYASLLQTPFVSLYSTSSWSEDLAECVAIYHLTRYLGQPFRILVTKNRLALAVYEPAIDRMTEQRMNLMSLFYSNRMDVF